MAIDKNGNHFTCGDTVRLNGQEIKVTGMTYSHFGDTFKQRPSSDGIGSFSESDCEVVMPKEATTVLDEASSIVNGARQNDYGPPELTHGRIADMWSTYLGVEVSSRDVCAMMVLLKVARDRHLPKRDNPVDIAGYAYLMDVV